MKVRMGAAHFLTKKLSTRGEQGQGTFNALGHWKLIAGIEG
jgi:hypothetical protein